MRDLTKAVLEKTYSVIRAQKTEEKKKIDWENRKNHWAMKNLGGFSLTLKKDLILKANTESFRISNYSNGAIPNMTCDFLYPRSNIDLIIPTQTNFNLIEITDFPGEPKINLKFYFENNPIEIKCTGYHTPSVLLMKYSIESYMTITLDDPIKNP